MSVVDLYEFDLFYWLQQKHANILIPVIEPLTLHSFFLSYLMFDATFIMDTYIFQSHPSVHCHFLAVISRSSLLLCSL